MEKHFRFFSVTPLLIVLLLVNSCKKVDVPPPPDLKFCNVSSITVTDNVSPAPITYTFTYDADGKPVRRISSRPTLATSNMYFLYDNLGRLSSVIAPYANIDPLNVQGTFGFDYWIKFTYNNQSNKLQPVADTVYSHGGFTNGAICCTTPVTENLTYDAAGRVSKVTSRTPGYVNEVEYKYDANGNLISSGRSYDDKVNIRRTNEVWMFLDRDYSRNNHFNVETFNAYGLPKKIGRNPSFLISRPPVFNIIEGTVSYMCDPK